jgi:hypothetical protein
MSGLLDAMMGPMMGMDPAVAQASQGMSRQLGQIRAMKYLAPPHGYAPGRVSSGRQAPNPLTFSPSNQTGDYSQFTFDPAARAQAEAAGIHPLDPSQVNPWAVLPNNQFFQNHQRLGRGIEGAIFGAASTQSGDTIGENISNVARGLIQGPMMRNQIYQQQFQAPFQRQQMMEQLQEQKDKHNLNDSEIRYHNAMANRADKDPPTKYYGHMAYKDGSIHAFDSATGEDVRLAPPGSAPDRPTKTPPGLAKYMGYINARAMDPDTMSPENWDTILGDYRKDQVAMATGKTAGGHAANLATDIAEGVKQPEEPKDLQTARDVFKSDMEKFNSKEYREQVQLDFFKQGIVRPSDKQIQDRIDEARTARQQKFDAEKEKLSPSKKSPMLAPEGVTPPKSSPKATPKKAKPQAGGAPFKLKHYNPDTGQIEETDSY